MLWSVTMNGVRATRLIECHIYSRERKKNILHRSRSQHHKENKHYYYLNSVHKSNHRPTCISTSSASPHSPLKPTPLLPSKFHSLPPEIPKILLPKLNEKERKRRRASNPSKQVENQNHNEKPPKPKRPTLFLSPSSLLPMRRRLSPSPAESCSHERW